MANIPQNTSYDKTVKKPVSWDVSKIKSLRQKISGTSTSSSSSIPYKYTSNLSRFKPETTASVLSEGQRFTEGTVDQDSSYKNKLVSDYNAQATGEVGTPTGAIEQYVTEGTSEITPTTKIANLNSQVGMSGQYLIDPENPGELIKNNYVFDPLLQKELLKGLPKSMYQLDHTVPRWAGGANTLGNIEVLDLATHQKKTDIQAVPYTLLYYSHLATVDPATMNPYQKQNWSTLSDDQKSYFKNNPITTQKARLLAMDWKNLSTAGVPHVKDEDYGLAGVSDAMNVYKQWTANSENVPKTGLMDWLKEIPNAGKTVLKETGKMLGNIPVLSGFARGATQGMIEGASLGYASGVAEGLSEENVGKVSNWQQMSPGGKLYLTGLIDEKKKTIKDFDGQKFLNTLTPEQIQTIEQNASGFGELANWGGDVSHAVGQVVGNVVGTALAFSKMEKMIFGGGLKKMATTAVSPLAKVMGLSAKAPKTVAQASETLKNTQAIVQEIIDAGKGVGPITAQSLKTLNQLQGVAKDGKVLVDTKIIDQLARTESMKRIAKSMGLQIAFGQLSAQPDGEMSTRVERAVADTLFGGLLGTQSHNVSGYAKTFMSALSLSTMENGYRVYSGKEDPDDLIQNSFTTAAIMTGLHALGHGNAKFELTGKAKKNAEADRIAKMSQDVSEDTLKRYQVLADPASPSSFEGSPLLDRSEFLELSGKDRVKYINWAKKQVTDMAENSVRINSDGTKMTAAWDDADLSKALQDIDIHFRNIEKGALGTKARTKADIADIKSYMERMKRTTTAEGIDTAPAQTIEDIVTQNQKKLSTPTNRNKATDEQKLIIGENAPVDGQFAVTGVSSRISARSNANAKRVLSAMEAGGTERVLDRAFIVHRPEMEPYIRQRESTYTEDVINENRVGFEKNPSDYVEVYVPLQNKETGNIEYVKVGNVATDHRLNSRMGYDEAGNLKDVAINHSDASIYPDFQPLTVTNDKLASWLREQGLKGAWVKMEKAFTGEKSREPFLSFSMSADDALQSMTDFANSGLQPSRTGIYRDVVQMAHVQNPQQAKMVADQIQKTREVEPADELLNIIHTEAMDEAEFTSLSKTEPMTVKKTVETNVENFFKDLRTAITGKNVSDEQIQSAYSRFVGDLIEKSPVANLIDIDSIHNTPFLTDAEIGMVRSKGNKLTIRDAFNQMSSLSSTHPAVLEAKNILVTEYYPKYFSNKGSMSVVADMPISGTLKAKVDAGEMKRFEPQTDEFGQKILPPEEESRMQDILTKKESVITENPVKTKITEEERMREQQKTQSTDRAVYTSEPIPNSHATVEIASERAKQALPVSELKQTVQKEVPISSDYSNFSGGENVALTKIISNKQKEYKTDTKEWKNLESIKKEFSKERMLENVKLVSNANVDENGYVNIGKAFEEYKNNLSETLKRNGIDDPFVNPKSSEVRDLMHWFQMNSKTVKMKTLSIKRNGDGKDAKYTGIATEDPNPRPYSRVDEEMERYNASTGRDLDLLYADSGKYGDDIINMGTDDGGAIIKDLFKKNGYIVLGAKGNTSDDIFGVKFNKALVDDFNTNEAKYTNGKESLTDEGKFVRVFAVDVLGLPKDVDSGTLIKRWKELNSHEMVNALRNDDGSVPKWKMTVLSKDFVEKKLGIKASKGFLEDGAIYHTRDDHRAMLEANAMDSRIPTSKPTYVTRLEDGTLIIQKGQNKAAAGEDNVKIKKLLGRYLEPGEKLSFNENVKIGKRDDDVWSYDLDATDMRIEWHNKHQQEGGLSFSNDSKFNPKDPGIMKLSGGYKKAYDRWSEFNAEALKAKNADALVVLYDKYSEYGLKESNQWDLVQNMMRNGAGIDDIRGVVQAQSQKILQDYVLGGRWMKGDHMRIVPETKSRYIDPKTNKISEERWLVSGDTEGKVDSEIAMSRKTWEKNGKPEYVLAYRTPTTRQTSMIKAKVVLIDNAGLGEELVMLPHDDVSIRLEGDYDADSIRFVTINDENFPMDLANVIQSNRKSGDINLSELTPYNKEYVTEDSLLRGAMNSIVGGKEVGKLASTMRILNDVKAANVSFRVKEEGGSYVMDVFGKNGVVDSIPLKTKKGEDLFTGDFKISWEEGNANHVTAVQMLQEALDSQKYQDMSIRLDDARRDGLYGTGEILIGKAFGTSDPVVIRAISKYLRGFQTPYEIESGKFDTREDISDALDSYRTFMKKFENAGGEKGVAGNIIDMINPETMIGDVGKFRAYKIDQGGSKAVRELANEQKKIGEYSRVRNSSEQVKKLIQSVQDARIEIAVNNWKRDFNRKFDIDSEVETSARIKDKILSAYKETRPSMTPEEDEAFRYFLLTDDTANLNRIFTTGEKGDKDAIKRGMADYSSEYIKNGSVKSEDALEHMKKQWNKLINEDKAYRNYGTGRVWRVADIFSDAPNVLAGAYYKGRQSVDTETGKVAESIKKNIKISTSEGTYVDENGEKKNFDELHKTLALLEKLKKQQDDEKIKNTPKARNARKYYEETYEKMKKLSTSFNKATTVEEMEKGYKDIRALRLKLERKIK